MSKRNFTYGLQIRVAPEMFDAVRERSRNTRVPASSLLRDAIDEMLLCPYLDFKTGKIKKVKIKKKRKGGE